MFMDKTSCVHIKKTLSQRQTKCSHDPQSGCGGWCRLKIIAVWQSISGQQWWFSTVTCSGWYHQLLARATNPPHLLLLHLFQSVSGCTIRNPSRETEKWFCYDGWKRRVWTSCFSLYCSVLLLFNSSEIWSLRSGRLWAFGSATWSGSLLEAHSSSKMRVKLKTHRKH